MVCKQRDVLVPCSALAWNNRQLGIATNTTCVCTVCCGDLLHSCLSCQPVELTHGTYGACSTAQHNSKQGAGLLGFTRKHSKTHMRRHFVRERKDVGDCEKGWPHSSTRCTQAMRECAPVGLRLSWCMCASRPPSPQETTLLSLSLCHFLSPGAPWSPSSPGRPGSPSAPGSPWGPLGPSGPTAHTAQQTLLQHSTAVSKHTQSTSDPGCLIRWGGHVTFC